MQWRVQQIHNISQPPSVAELSRGRRLSDKLRALLRKRWRLFNLCPISHAGGREGGRSELRGEERRERERERERERSLVQWLTPSTLLLVWITDPE